MAARLPTVSVCIPTYNRCTLLREALESVLGQTFGDFEALIVDNASEDDTPAVMSKYRDPRIRYVRNATNIGHRANWNLCLKLARGKYIAILPDDDAMLAENLARKVAVLEAQPRMGLVHSKYHLIDGEGRITRERTNWGHGPERQGDIVESREHILTAPYNVVNVSAAVFRRECYTKLGGFTDKMRYSFDWEYFMRIAVYWEVYFLDEALIQWRIHGGSITHVSVSQEITKLREDLAAKQSVCSEHLRTLPNARALKKQMGLNIAVRVVRRAESMLNDELPDEEVRAFLRESYRAFPEVFRDRRLWNLSLRAMLGRSRIQAVKRIPFLFPKRRSASLPR